MSSPMILGKDFGREMGKGFVEELSSNAGRAIDAFFQVITQTQDQFGASVNKTFLERYLPIIVLTGLASTALPLLYHYIHHVMLRSIGKPSLALKDRRTTWLSQLKGCFIKPVETPASKPIFNAELDQRIQDIVEATNNIKKNGSFFQNVLLYGPGGTGKTMLAEMIAKNSQMDYMMMSGGELGQFIQRGEHVTELNRLWKAAEKSLKPVVIFIDEAESLCRVRHASTDQKYLELQNAFLNKTGTASKQIMLVLATNRPQDIDPAVLSRVPHKLYIGPPGVIERAKIIYTYVQQFFGNTSEQMEIFSPNNIADLAIKTENFTGRSLFFLINSLFAKKGSSSGNRLDKETADRMIRTFIEQENNLNFAQEFSSAPPTA